jgi:hypothetical protein
MRTGPPPLHSQGILGNTDHRPEPDQGGAWAMCPQLVVALGIGIAGVKHPLAVEEGLHPELHH